MMKFARASLRKSNFVIIYLKYINCKILFILFSFKKYFVNSMYSLKKKIRRLNKGLEEKISFPPTSYYSLPFLMFCFTSSSLCWKPCPVLFLSLTHVLLEHWHFGYSIVLLLSFNENSQMGAACSSTWRYLLEPGGREFLGVVSCPESVVSFFLLLNLDIISEIGWNSRKPR